MKTQSGFTQMILVVSSLRPPGLPQIRTFYFHDSSVSLEVLVHPGSLLAPLRRVSASDVGLSLLAPGISTNFFPLAKYILSFHMMAFLNFAQAPPLGMEWIPVL